MLTSSRKRGIDVGLRALGFAVWLSFILSCIGLNQSHGLSCADDAWFAIIAKSLANGIGYATTFSEPGEFGHLTQFNPFTGTGPTLIVPCALAFGLIGKSEVVPGLIAIFMWGGLLTFLLIRIGRRTDAASFLLGVSVMCAAFFATFSYHFEHWYAFLGEIVAAALVIVAHWILANERFSKNWLLLAGLALGLAFQAKLLAAVAMPGIVLLFVIRGIDTGCRPAQWLRYAAILSIGLVMPTLVFEGYKLFQLGFHGYAMNWQELLAATKERGVGSDTHLTWPFLQGRMASVYERFGLNLLGLLALIATGALLLWRSASKNWTLLSTGLLLSAATAAVYWATLSTGWPRYLVICVTMTAFLLSIPIFTLERWPKLLFTCLVLLLLTTGLSRTGRVLDSVDRGLFRSTTNRVARASLVQVIEQRKKAGPIILASRWWGSFADVEFLLSGSMNFERLETVDSLPGPKLILFNSRFDPAPDAAISAVKARPSSIVFAGGSYVLIEAR